MTFDGPASGDGWAEEAGRSLPVFLPMGRWGAEGRGSDFDLGWGDRSFYFHFV
jgi:hypothetical protein